MTSTAMHDSMRPRKVQSQSPAPASPGLLVRPSIHPVIGAPLGLTVALLAVMAAMLVHADTAPVPVTNFSITNGRPELQFDPVPSANQYRIEYAPSLAVPFQTVTDGYLSLFQWNGTPTDAESGLYRVTADTVTTNDLVSINLLNRIAYGPTPDELDRVRAMGPDAYIEEQLAPERIAEDLDHGFGIPRWTKVSGSARMLPGADGSFAIYFALSQPGDCYVDDVRLVLGKTDDGRQPNLIQNGGFESDLGSTWNVTTNLAGSAISTAASHGGNQSLHLITSTGGFGRDTSVFQLVTARIDSSQTYTLSYWVYAPGVQKARVTGRADSGVRGDAQLITFSAGSPSDIFPALNAGTAKIEDLRAWHILTAVQSRKQLAEVMRQFWENHFVTEYTKSQDYLGGQGLQGDAPSKAATELEFRENIQWRKAFENPQATFHDFLKISAESPAMIIYLDTVSSRGDGSNIANENYARELCELFSFGVDNGYDQQDIVEISKVWSGWTVEYVATNQVGNPFAPRSRVYKNPKGRDVSNITNLIGDWSVHYNPSYHSLVPKKIFFNRDGSGNATTTKTVPGRFGPPWAGRSYGLTISASRPLTNSYDEGHKLIFHMANQPFTEEFISVKLCRLFVHEGFHTGYDFTDDQTTPEEDLVHACMMAWENPPNGGPQGQIRDVLRVIFNSPLFRSNDAALHKVKTPLEFGVSAVRALRTLKTDGTYTATTDGRGVQDLLEGAGRMHLFDRAEPDGYPEAGTPWISAGTLAKRLRFIQAALMPSGMDRNGEASEVYIDPTSLLTQKLTVARQRDTDSVVDFFLGLLFPAEGHANLTEYHTLGVKFLNTGENGITSDRFSSYTPASPLYDQRVRGLVSLLMATARFQEQ
jgi:uncharacterized protein (DUF1800 family)